MNTLTYATSNVSSKDVLAISSLLSLFERRLSAKWVMRNHPPGQNIDVLVVDVDRPGGADTMREPGPASIRVAVSDNDRAPEAWLVTRPIRAYGANGVVVLFNSLAEALQTGQGEASEAPQLRIVQNGAEKRPAQFVAAAAAASVTTAPVPAPPPIVAAPPPPPPPPVAATAPPPPEMLRAPEVKWGPPEPVEVPALVDMRNGSAETQVRLPEPPKAATAAPPPPPPPVQAAPVVQLVSPSPRPAAHRWREPEPEVMPELIDMRTGRPVVWPKATPVVVIAAPQPMPVAAPIVIAVAEPPAAVPAPQPEPQPVLVPAAVAPAQTQEPEVAAPVESYSVSAAIAEPETPAVEIQEPAEDSGTDWWSTPAAAAEPAPPVEIPEGETELAQLLRDIKRAEKIGVLEIAGLPAVCMVPGRRAYYTAAPAARLEAAIATKARATFRTCASEEEARSLSGTEDSRQASLNQLYWSAALAGASAPLPSALNEGPLRLKGWPPVNSASGGGRYLRFATLLSGGAVSAQQLATLTGSDPKEVTAFLQACNELGLVETADPQRRAVSSAARNTGKVGILRSMLAQLTPPKI